nr:lamin tail domain-containing protein [uncultured Draconibacterium sp.]
MEDIAFVIKSINPDIINLVEVEGLDALNRLNTNYLQGMNYKAYLIKGKDTYTGQDVGLLTRIDPENGAIERYPNKGLSNGVEKSVSKNYYAKFDIGGRKIAIVSLHFLAIPSNPNNINPRQTQADAIRQIAEQLDNEGFSLLVMGDFNDYDGDQCCLDMNDNIPITTVLRDIKNLSNNTNSDDLLNVHQFISKSNRYTAFWDRDNNDAVSGINEFSIIVHILIAPELVQLIDSTFIFHDYDPTIISDHFPVTIRFDFNKNTNTSSSVKIVSLVPNPSGAESQNERITLHNLTNNMITLSGWKVRDIANNIWTINTTINPNSTDIIKRNGQKMSLNNSGDAIELIDENGTVVQTFTYPRANEEEEIIVNI